MKTNAPSDSKPRLEKVGECLYRYSLNGVHYALLKNAGKQKKKSLETTDKAVAKRKLTDFRRQLGMVDVSAVRAASPILVVRLKIYLGLEKWKLMQTVAQMLALDDPKNPQWDSISAC